MAAIRRLLHPLRSRSSASVVCPDCRMRLVAERDTLREAEAYTDEWLAEHAHRHRWMREHARAAGVGVRVHLTTSAVEAAMQAQVKAMHERATGSGS